MKRFFCLLTAIVLCMSLAACREQVQEARPGETAGRTEQTSTPEPSAPGTDQTETAAMEATDVTVPFGGMSEGLTPGDNVIPPDEMPEKPDADYTLPPEFPGKSETS